MINLKNYSDEHINQALYGVHNTRRVTFRFALLDYRDIETGELDGILSASVSHGEFNAIKRTARFTVDENFQTKEINFLTDRIQPWFVLHMPEGGTVEWPLGIFLLESPDLSVDGSSRVRNIGAYDKSIILTEYRLPHRQFFGKGTKYIAAVNQILSMAGITKVKIEDSDAKLAFDKEFPVGTTAGDAVSDLLKAVNYTGISVDSYGYACSQAYVPPFQRVPTKYYSVTDNSAIAPEFGDKLDIAGRPNVFIRVARNIETETSLVSRFVNNDPKSPLSTVSRGREITSFEEIENIANQDALDAFVRRIAVESTSAYRHFRFQTLLMPHHGSAETLYLDIPEMFDTPMKFSETSWEMPLTYNGLMSHEARVAVNL